MRLEERLQGESAGRLGSERLCGAAEPRKEERGRVMRCGGGGRLQ